MTWLDIVLGVLLVMAAVLEMSRGFGRAIFDALALYGALWLAESLSHTLDAAFFHPNTSISHCWTFGVLFLTFGALAFLVSGFVYHSTLLNMGMFEGLLGLGAGVAVGMILAHAVVRIVAMSDPTGHGSLLIADSFLGNEMLRFTTYHSFIETLSGVTASHRELPNVAG